MNRIYFKILLVIVSLLYPAFMLAASFDCGKATVAIEKTICGDSQLSELDSRLGEEYQKLKQSLAKDSAAKLQQAQQDWLKQRLTDCSVEDIQCLSHLYQQRIDVLSAPTVEKLQGKWQSTEDKKSVVEIVDHHYIDYYEGKLVNKVTFEILSACKVDNGKVQDRGEYLETADESCYHIDAVTSQELTLMYLPRGNLLVYEKLKD
jgi:uncharacterized protein